MIGLLLLLTQATDQSVFPTSFSLIGMGTESCATAFKENAEPYTRQWIAGFVSGANGRDGGHVGTGTDLNGVVGEVKLLCSREPSKLLAWAALTAYEKLRPETWEKYRPKK